MTDQRPRSPNIAAGDELTLADFEYDLPPDLIAQFPSATRTGSRLLVADKDHISDLMFSDLPTLLRAGDLLVFNDTRVIKARLHGIKSTGGRVEVLIERVTGTHTALAHIRASKSPKAGSTVHLRGEAGEFDVTVTGRDTELFALEFSEPVTDVMQAIGHVPLPPYIDKEDDANDEARYQTVYARHPGAVAAPTAGLHFDEAMLQALNKMGVEHAWVTLHVGAGTFAPVRENDLSRHQMHSERWEVDAQCVNAIHEARARGSRIIAVGTTSVRALESCAAQSGSTLTPGSGDTRLFIRPGYQWQVVDTMLTNFHLPGSTLLMLVAAFCGLDEMRRLYAHAIAKHYRFFSYGDAMFIERTTKND